MLKTNRRIRISELKRDRDIPGRLKIATCAYLLSAILYTNPVLYGAVLRIIMADEKGRIT
jgi:hypothetical protein